MVTLDALLAQDEALHGRSLIDLVREKDSDAGDRYLAQRQGDGFS